jgi:hypothetical protein
VRVLMAGLTGANDIKPGAAIGWGGDRYRIYQSPAGPVLVWYLVWDDKASGERFVTQYGPRLRKTDRTGYRATLETIDLEGRSAMRYVLAPETWAGWQKIPQVAIGK